MYMERRSHDKKAFAKGIELERVSEHGTATIRTSFICTVVPGVGGIIGKKQRAAEGTLGEDTAVVVVVSGGYGQTDICSLDAENPVATH